MADGVEIDTGQVGDFAKGMRSEAATGFNQVANRGTRLHSYGVPFGSRITMSDIVQQAKGRYAVALSNTEANLRAYQQAAEIFADVADDIAREFKGTDRNNAEATARVSALMDGAIAKANEIIAGAPGARRAV
ncbi:hypothetical protein AB0M54_21840 [Actinoplanes sp. NPDC051470]|uniref:hypothetical protein n=1 Tax=Actinoplanes sp. NPDC051470 TaxID=3157224 RepID=UPI003440A5DD